MQDLTSTINKIYKDNLQYLPRWKTAYANHVSMFSAALFLMREHAPITPEKLLKDAAAYTRQLSPRRENSSGIDIKKLPWSRQQQLLGHDDLYESWFALFRRRFDSEQLDDEIACWLHRLGRGLCAGAGHSVIRIFYALAMRQYLEEAIFREELAIAFSDLASRYLPLTLLDESGSLQHALPAFIARQHRYPQELLEEVQAGQLIEDRLMIIRAQDKYLELTKTVRTDFEFEPTLVALSEVAARTTDFSLLHGLTVGHALLEIFACLPALDQSTLRQGYRDFIVAASTYADRSDDDTAEANSVALEDIFQAVPDLIDDHAQKASFSLTELYRHFPRPQFLIAARSYQLGYG